MNLRFLGIFGLFDNGQRLWAWKPILCDFPFPLFFNVVIKCQMMDSVAIGIYNLDKKLISRWKSRIFDISVNKWIPVEKSSDLLNRASGITVISGIKKLTFKRKFCDDPVKAFLLIITSPWLGYIFAVISAFYLRISFEFKKSYLAVFI